MFGNPPRHPLEDNQKNHLFQIIINVLGGGEDNLAYKGGDCVWNKLIECQGAIKDIYQGANTICVYA